MKWFVVVMTSANGGHWLSRLVGPRSIKAGEYDTFSNLSHDEHDAQPTIEPPDHIVKTRSLVRRVLRPTIESDEEQLIDE